MTQESQVVLDDEDQMSQALAEIRADRSGDAPEVADPVAAAPVASDPVATPSDAPAAPESTPVDPAEKLKSVQAELHRAQSEIGRVGALNRKYMDAAREAAQLREQLALVQNTNQPPASASDAAARLSQVADQVKDFPELAGIVAAVTDALKQADQKTEGIARRVAAQVIEPLEPLRREQASRREQENAAAFNAAMQTFNSTYPTAVQVVQSDDFKQWLNTQPPNVQYTFAKGQTPLEAMTVLDTYDMHLRRTGRNPISQFANAQPAPAPVRSVDNRLQRAAGLPSRASGSQGGQPPADDFEASLAYFRNKRLRAAAA